MGQQSIKSFFYKKRTGLALPEIVPGRRSRDSNFNKIISTTQNCALGKFYNNKSKLLTLKCLQEIILETQ
jgi:hypothetical protein